jgi:protease-4
MKWNKPSQITLLIVLHAAVLGASLGFLGTRKRLTRVSDEKIVIVPVEGLITYESSSLGQGISVDNIVETFDELREDDDVKAVVLRINSPGGSVGAVQEIYRSIMKFRQKGKVVVASFGDISASGGYYIACAGDRIVTNPGTITGSIGVIMQMPNVTGLLQKIGVSMMTIKSGAMKDSASPFREMKDEERQYLQGVIHDAYNQFFDAVKEGRHMDEKTLRPLADGRIFSGRLAKELKLVDELGGLEEAVELAKQLSGLDKKKPQIIHHHGKTSLERLLNLLSKEPLAPLSHLGSATTTKLEYVLQ